MTDERKPYSLERRPSGLAVVEEGQMGVSDLAVFYPNDRQLALAVVHFLNGEFGEAAKAREEWRSGRRSLGGVEKCTHSTASAVPARPLARILSLHLASPPSVAERTLAHSVATSRACADSSRFSIGASPLSVRPVRGQLGPRVVPPD